MLKNVSEDDVSNERIVVPLPTLRFLHNPNPKIKKIIIVKKRLFSLILVT